MWLAAGSSGIGLVPLYYIVTILGVLGGGAVALYRWQKSQRQQWQSEGMHAARQAEALTANTEAAKHNTEAISRLTDELREFVTETRAQFREQNGRIGRLEDRRHLGG